MDTIRNLTLALIGTLTFAFPALAANGVREIDQTTVNALGGFPYRIQSPGSYVLTSHLEIPDVDTTGIAVEASHVTIDLNGFSIRCASCSGTGTGDGIFADATRGNVSVRDGSVSGVGNRGVAVEGFVGLVERIQVSETGGTGIFLGESSLVIDSQATHNAQGIQIGKGSAVIDSIGSWNGGNGVQLDEFAVISGVAANEKTGSGIAPTEGSVVIRSTANMNGQRGLFSEEAAILESSFQSNQGTGIECFECLITSNNVVDNGGYGINADDKAGYAGNMIRGNSTAPLPSVNVRELGDNVCDDSRSCP